MPSGTYTVKLEGARIAGYQTILMALLRDAHYLANPQIWCGDIMAKHVTKVADRMGLDPATASCTSPDAIAVITAEPELNRRHSMARPVASSNTPDPIVAFQGLIIP